jgi:hypothetical protein
MPGTFGGEICRKVAIDFDGEEALHSSGQRAL